MSDWFTKHGEYCNACGLEPCVCGPMMNATSPPVHLPRRGGLERREENLFRPNCIRTVSGRYVNILDPNPETFDIGDIAHALARIPRFGGHLPVFYSVAQHSLAVSYCAGLTGTEAYQGLMHDSSEAFLLDLPTPLKDVLPEYKRIEARMMKRLAVRFGFPWPMLPRLKAADRAELLSEWQDLMITGVAVGPRYATDVERMFLARFNELQP